MTTNEAIDKLKKQEIQIFDNTKWAMRGLVKAFQNYSSKRYYSSDGFILFSRNNPIQHLPIINVSDIVDEDGESEPNLYDMAKDIHTWMKPNVFELQEEGVSNDFVNGEVVEACNDNEYSRKELFWYLGLNPRKQTSEVASNHLVMNKQGQVLFFDFCRRPKGVEPFDWGVGKEVVCDRGYKVIITDATPTHERFFSGVVIESNEGKYPKGRYSEKWVKSAFKPVIPD